MKDLWAFLIQTLTASGAAVILLLLKALLRDKLSPRWQFSIWGILGLTLVIPVGVLGEYVLFDWPRLVEAAKTAATGSYALTHVTAPVPLLPSHVPQTLWDWLFAGYFAGVVGLLLWNLIGYLRLRSILHRGQPATQDTVQTLERLQKEFGLKSCRAVQVPGLQSAFVCGLIRPILALPAERKTDEKVLLHELLHLQHRDVFWGVGICVLRCIHWCNPLLWYCANLAGNDMESLCDQRVLEKLEGEDRREYGRILLSMANDAYARMPGTSSVSNGGRNIRLRIEAIARFKRYPAGMGLVSVCIAVVLLSPLVFGIRSREVPKTVISPSERNLVQAVADARLIQCRTLAGAIDTYAKALMTDNGLYRIMCAPEALYTELSEQTMEQIRRNGVPHWENNLPEKLDSTREYGIFSLDERSPDHYTALLVLYTEDQPQTPPDQFLQMELCIQKIHIRREKGSWVVDEVEPPELQVMDNEELSWGCKDLPSVCYRAETENFRVEVFRQISYVVQNQTMSSNPGWLSGSAWTFESVPKPHAAFDRVNDFYWCVCTYTGDPEKKEDYHSFGISYAPWEAGAEKPELESDLVNESAGSSSSGHAWSSRSLEPGWADEILIGGGGTTRPPEKADEILADRYAAVVYLNDQPGVALTLEREVDGK